MLSNVTQLFFFLFFFSLQSLLKTADQLKIKGLCEVPDSKDNANETEGTSAPSSFRTNINLFGSDYQQQQQTNQSVRAFNLDHVVHPLNVRNSYLPSELSLNQLPRIKQSTSPPLYTNESFVPTVTKALYGTYSDTLSQNPAVRRPGTKRLENTWDPSRGSWCGGSKEI